MLIGVGVVGRIQLLVVHVQVISHFGIEGETLVLIASVPGNCLSFTF